MRDDNAWRLFQVDCEIHVPPPTSTDPQEWATWCDKKAAAALRLREEALLLGEIEAAGAAEHMHDSAVRSARRLRRATGGG